MNDSVKILLVSVWSLFTISAPMLIREIGLWQVCPVAENASTHQFPEHLGAQHCKPLLGILGNEEKIRIGVSYS